VERALIVEASEDARTATLIADQLARAGIPAHRVALPDTQAAKTFSAAERVADALADHALHKDDSGRRGRRRGHRRPGRLRRGPRSTAA